MPIIVNTVNNLLTEDSGHYYTAHDPVSFYLTKKAESSFNSDLNKVGKALIQSAKLVLNIASMFNKKAKVLQTIFSFIEDIGAPETVSLEKKIDSALKALKNNIKNDQDLLSLNKDLQKANDVIKRVFNDYINTYVIDINDREKNPDGFAKAINNMEIDKRELETKLEHLTGTAGYSVRYGPYTQTYNQGVFDCYLRTASVYLLVFRTLIEAENTKEGHYDEGDLNNIIKWAWAIKEYIARMQDSIDNTIKDRLVKITKPDHKSYDTQLLRYHWDGNYYFFYDEAKYIGALKYWNYSPQYKDHVPDGFESGGSRAPVVFTYGITSYNSINSRDQQPNITLAPLENRSFEGDIWMDEDEDEKTFHMQALNAIRAEYYRRAKAQIKQIFGVNQERADVMNELIDSATKTIEFYQPALYHLRHDG